ncbi:MAG: hypothetical protein MUO26_06930 [Methanotrichaceae archaeon]|nr:hypothetical protein [Methanotrichaceae archaeon]
MTKFLILWHKNLIPEDPEKMAKQNLSLLEGVKAALKSGMLKDWGVYCDGYNGYVIAEGTEADIFATLLKWMPYILFDVHPVANVDQAVEANTKLMAESKPK